MPDWSYRTILRPALFALPADAGRDLAIGSMGLLARLPWGGAVIDFLGHMRSPPELAVETLGRKFAAPIGFGAELDPSLFALPAFARFGVGFIEIGPVSSAPPPRSLSFVRRDTAEATITTSAQYLDVAPEALAATHHQASGTPRIVRVRWAPQESDAWLNSAAALAFGPDVAALSIDALPAGGSFEPQQVESLRGTLDALAARVPPHVRLLLTMPSNLSPTHACETLARLKESTRALAGVVVAGGFLNDAGEYVWGAPARAGALELTRALRARFAAQELAIVAGGGVHEPRHALDLLHAGANLVKVESGLIFTGPGLTKRCNEALLSEQALAADLQQNRVDPADPAQRHDASPARWAWFWMLLMGLAMGGGGLMALIIASTRVVLPYDEEFVGMTRAELAEIPRLLSFMTHDRVTLAGTMLSIGVFYTSLAWFGVRRGEHWAWVAVLISALSGFLSFFSFLGFGYFEPFHAFVTAVLFQFLLLAWHAPLPRQQVLLRAPLEGDTAWLLSLWGQLGLVLEACAGLAAGAIILFVGSTQVFVHEDLEFMGTCTYTIASLEPKLLALVAHDRATFGGMLISCGLVQLMATLWGFMAGRRWLWVTLLAAGTVGYVTTIIVHHGVGYTSFIHLLPAYLGLAWHWLSLGLAAPYLLAKK